MPRVFCALVLSLIAALPVNGAPILLRGSVRGIDGAGLAGCQVELVPMATNFAWNRRILEGRARPLPAAVAATDATGRFAIEAPEQGVWRLIVEAEGHVPMRLFPLALVESAELAPVTLRPDAGSQVQVRDAAGEPFEGAWILARSSEASFWTPLATDGWRVGSRIARTDVHGRSSLPRAAGEQLTVFAYVRGTVEPLSTDGRERMTLQLGQRPARGRLIQVRDEQAEPVAGLAVGAGDNAWPMGWTDSAGRLELAGSWSAPQALHLFAADGHSQTMVVDAADSAPPTPLSILWHSSSRVAGRVLEARSRRPLQAALVWPGADPGRAVETDSRGVFELPAPPGERFWLQAEHAGFLPRTHWIEHAGLEREAAPAPMATVMLQAATVVAGEVVAAEGAPLADVALRVVAATPASRPRAFHPDRAISRSTSDPRGRFRLPTLGPDGSYELLATKPGFSTRKISLARPGHPEAALRIVLLKARPGSGKVVDLAGRAIAGAEIMVRPTLPMPRPPKPWKATSDEVGRFELADVAAPRLDLATRHPDYAPLTVRGVAVKPGEGPIDLGTLRLEPGISIRGEVTDPAGEPVAEVDVWIVRTRGLSASPHPERILRGKPVAHSDLAGRFTIGELERDETFHLFFDRDGYQRASLQGVEAPPPTPLVVVLEPAAEVRGRVVDEAGEPVAGAMVSLRGRESESGSLELPQRDLGDAQATPSDEHGTFAFAEVVPGDLEIDAVARGFQPTQPLPFELAAGEVQSDLVLTLERGATLEGRVTDGEGAGVAEARLAIDRASAQSDGDGYYQLEGVPSGRRSLRINHPEYNRFEQTLEIEPGLNAADWVLEGGWPVAGRVLDEAGSAVAGARVRLRLQERRGRREYRVVSGEDGAFRVAGVAVGRYAAEAEKAGYARAELHEALEVKDGPVDEVELRLLPGGSIVGRILGLDFEDLAAVQVRAEVGDRPSQRATLDYQGGYAIDDLGPGDWLVKGWLAGGRRQTEARVTLAPGARTVTQDLEFGRGLTLSGVVHYNDQPLAGTDISLRGYGVTVRRSVVTNYQGAFVLDDLEPGRYRIDASNPRELVLYNRDLELADHRELEIKIEAARVSGTVTSTRDNGPVAGALVTIQKMLSGAGAAPGSLITLASNDQGSFSVARVGAGHYRLAASKEGFAPAEQMLDVEPGIDLEGLELALSPTEGLDLRLRLASGAPTRSARISVLDAAGRPVHLDSRTTDAHGLVHFPSAPAGAWDLLVDVPGGVVQQLTAVAVPTDEPLEILLPDATRVEVRVPSLIQANLVGSLSAVDPEGRFFLGLGPHGTLLRDWPLPAGSGRLEGLPPGPWTLRAVAPDGRIWQQTIVAAPGADLRVDLE